MCYDYYCYYDYCFYVEYYIVNNYCSEYFNEIEKYTSIFYNFNNDLVIYFDPPYECITTVNLFCIYYPVYFYSSSSLLFLFLSFFPIPFSYFPLFLIFFSIFFKHFNISPYALTQCTVTGLLYSNANSS